MTPQFRAALDDLFAAARKADLGEVAGVKLYRCGRRWRGECPVCGASRGKKADGAFSADTAAGLWTCWAHGKGGDAVALEQAIRGGSLREAAARLAPAEAIRLDQVIAAEGGERRRETSPSPARLSPPQREPRPYPKSDFHLALAGDLWGEAVAAPGTPVETYLRARGITGEVLERATNRVRFHPRAYHHGGWRDPVCHPAMVARVVTAEGPTGGVHVTYLRPDGLGKIAEGPAKRMWGPQGCERGPGGVWLTRPTDPGPLVVGEGIETSLSAAILLGRPCRLVAALSLGALQGGWLSDKWGRRDPLAVNGDPQGPAFTWPEPMGHPWGEVLIAVDRDMSPINVKARMAMGGSYQRRLTGDERARICGALAEQAWRRAGAARVRTIAPAAGRDFSDELMAGL